MDLKRKLASRKLWMSIIGLVSATMVLIGADPGTSEKVAAVIMQGATVIAYVVAEGFIDGKREEGDTVIVDESCDDVIQ